MHKADALKAMCRKRFDPFLHKAFNIVECGVPYEWNWHIGCIAEHLEALHYGELPDGKKRLAINIPPRTLKSFTGSVSFPTWVMGLQPHAKFICTSFNFKLAKSMAQKARIIMESDFYRETFPETVIDQKQNEKHNFWTTQRGMYYSSALQSVTGTGADYVILDDPINPKEAISQTIRDTTNETISSTIPTRFNDARNAKWLMIMQRLHDNDPTGHFVEDDDRWHLLKLPAENKTSKPFVYIVRGNEYRLEPNQLLFPQRLTREVLDDFRDDLGDYNYAGQILQEPVPVGGNELQVQWVQHYAQGGISPKTMNVVILADAAGGEETNKKKNKNSDWTAMMVVGLAPDNNYYLLDIVRDRLNPTERIETLFLLHRKWNGLCGKPPKVGYEEYGLMTDIHYIRKKQKEDGYNFPIIKLGGRMNKEDRIRRLIPDLQTNRWYFPHSLMYVDNEGRTFDLIQEILTSEMPTFPKARFDDMLDALSRIYEDDLKLVFPKPKKSKPQHSTSTGSQEEDWIYM